MTAEGIMVLRSEIASWAKSMAQLMKQEVVTMMDVEMLLDAHGLEIKKDDCWKTRRELKNIEVQ